MRKIIIIILTSFILNNCGYTPIYSSKEKNFYIQKISQKKTSKLNSKIANKLKIFSNKSSKNIIQIEISSVKKIETKDGKNYFLKKDPTKKVIVGPSESMSKSKKNTIDPEEIIEN